MPQRINLIAGAAFLSLIASGAAFAAPEATTPAAAPTDCAAAPKQDVPSGGHWYYRTDRTTKRKCWFVGDASAKSTTTAVTKPSQSVTPAPEKAAKEISPSVSNARAEIPNPQAAADDEKLQASIWPPLPDGAAAEAAPTDAEEITASPLRAAEAAPPQETATSKFTPNAELPTQPVTANTADIKPALDNSDTETTATLPPSPQPAVVAAAAVSQSTPTSNPNSMPTLLAALACALGLAFILGGIVIKFFNQQRALVSRADDRPQRRDIWSDVAVDEIPTSYPAMPRPSNLDDIAHATHDSEDPEIERLLSKASRRRAA